MISGQLSLSIPYDQLATSCVALHCVSSSSQPGMKGWLSGRFSRHLQSKSRIRVSRGKTRLRNNQGKIFDERDCSETVVSHVVVALESIPST